MWTSNVGSYSSGSSGVVPFTISVPARSTAGQSSGSVTIIDPYTARIQLAPALSVPNDAVAYLQTASFPYSYPNVAGSGILLSIPQGNNRVTITFGLAAPVDVLLPIGLYSYLDAAYALNQAFISNGWTTNQAYQAVTLQGIAATQQIVMTLNPLALGGSFPAGGLTLSFVNPSPVSGLSNSMGDLLGFGYVALTAATGSASVSYTGANAANFATQSAYILNMSLVKDSYLNGSSSTALYAFPLGSQSTNSIIEYQPKLKNNVPLISGKFSFVDLWFTDQAGLKLSLAYFDGPISVSLTICRSKSN